jgi:hypothetical protein
VIILPYGWSWPIAAAHRLSRFLAPHRLSRHSVLAAGVAVTVALCLSLAGTIRIMPLRAVPGSHVVRAMALVRFADDNPECSPALGPGQPVGCQKPA